MFGYAPKQLTLRQSLLAAISTMLVWGLEYYDIILFASLAPILEMYFFPSKVAIVSAIETWGAFATTYFVRPIGAIIFGWIGDVRGRRLATISDAALVGLATLAIGLLPTYYTAGVLAPILLYLMRILQGIGLGGEAGGGASWALELTPRNIRPYINGVMYSGLSWAVFLTSFVTLSAKSAMHQAFNVYGWRILFITGAIPALIALIIRLWGSESLEWVEQVRSRGVVKVPLGVVLSRYWVPFIALILINLGLTIYYYGGSGYWAYVMPKIIAPKLQLPANKAYTWALILGMYGGIGAVIGELLSGFLIRALGIRRSFIAPSTLLLVLSPFIVYLAFTLNPLSIYASLLMGILFGLTAAPQTLYFTSIFPTEVRWSAVAFGWNLNASIGPLSTMAIVLLLETAPSSPMLLAIYGSVVMMIGALLVILGSLIRTREY
ncbi:MFS transporter [Vulcanisaeta distributa]|uniref:Major facilitator superfamily MFS_1 n=1 Tax=Vulcanisaeta distributa (strain DSM 14429 / JCM 11212 / NBRC 100878 / IC-017) TaxID=572478 RepID=E1QS98_VULDI|nr:MFS transporter [Vulcanisaeta distributa]ADN49491.1 major facilitator superfamily MFS_1 [Vulcanisaeta distributa DSM 14429]